MEKSELLWFASALILLTNAATLSALAPTSVFRRVLFQYAGGLGVAGLAFLALAFRGDVSAWAPVQVVNMLIIVGVLMLLLSVSNLFDHGLHRAGLIAVFAVTALPQFAPGHDLPTERLRYALLLLAVLYSVTLRIWIAIRHHRADERAPVVMMASVLAFNAVLVSLTLVQLWTDPVEALASTRQGGVAIGVALVSVLALIATMLVVNQRTHAALRELADRDGLTGAFNRRAFLEYGSLWPSTQAALVIMLDFDHFKRVNDQHGHLAGDQVLSAGVARLRRVLGDRGLVGRHGGEEFAIVCRCDTAAEPLLDDLRRAVCEAGSEALGVPVTASLGATRFRAGERLVDALQRADEALYRAKSEGRDRAILG
jgi:diguanylate cyclase (GGDEF)-like protein